MKLALLAAAGTSAALAIAGLAGAGAPPSDRAGSGSGPCVFAAGARATETLGLSEAQRRAIPITHVVVVMQENRSFDHYFGKLAQQGQPAAEGIPPDFSNPDLLGRPVRHHHLDTTCVQQDPPHQWDAMHLQWNEGRMDGFVRSAGSATGDGRDAMGHYDQSDLPFYYWLARTFAISDRHFSSVLGGTWHNRHFLYAGTSRRRAKTGQLTGVPTIFDRLDGARVAWGVYSESGVRQDCLGWASDDPRVQRFDRFLAQLGAGTLPPVSFVDPGESDEHPPNDIQTGEAWFRRIYLAATRSPLWPRLALFLTYDEAGGFFDHVPPPTACAPAANRPEFTQLGTRIPLLLVSPWARPHHVSHQPSDHTALLRLIELLHNLPALSARDANSGALLDMFDFSAPQPLPPPPHPPAPAAACVAPGTKPGGDDQCSAVEMRSESGIVHVHVHVRRARVS